MSFTEYQALALIDMVLITVVLVMIGEWADARHAIRELRRQREDDYNFIHDTIFNAIMSDRKRVEKLEAAKP